MTVKFEGIELVMNISALCEDYKVFEYIEKYKPVEGQKVEIYDSNVRVVYHSSKNMLGKIVWSRTIQ